MEWPRPARSWKAFLPPSANRIPQIPALVHAQTSNGSPALVGFSHTPNCSPRSCACHHCSPLEHSQRPRMGHLHCTRQWRTVHFAFACWSLSRRPTQSCSNQSCPAAISTSYQRVPLRKRLNRRCVCLRTCCVRGSCSVAAACTWEYAAGRPFHVIPPRATSFFALKQSRRSSVCMYHADIQARTIRRGSSRSRAGLGGKPGPWSRVELDVRVDRYGEGCCVVSEFAIVSLPSTSPCLLWSHQFRCLVPFILSRADNPFPERCSTHSARFLVFSSTFSLYRSASTRPSAFVALGQLRDSTSSTQTSAGASFKLARVEKKLLPKIFTRFFDTIVCRSSLIDSSL